MQTVLRIDGHTPMRTLAPLLGLGAQVAKDTEGTHWVKVDSDSADINARLACVAANRFLVERDQWLLRPGERTATAKLPAALRWEKLDDVIQVDLPAASLAAQKSMTRQTLALVRGGRPQRAEAIITPLDVFSSWVETASETRLRRLRWVLRDREASGDSEVLGDSEALVLGTPLPPIDGRYLVDHQRVLIPAGYVWQPAIRVAEVREVFGVAKNCWLVWESDSSWSQVDDDAWMSLRRASVRSASVRSASVRGLPAMREL